MCEGEGGAYLCILLNDLGVLSLYGEPQFIILCLQVLYIPCYIRLQRDDLGLPRLDQAELLLPPAIRLAQQQVQVEVVFPRPLARDGRG